MKRAAFICSTSTTNPSYLHQNSRKIITRIKVNSAMSSPTPSWHPNSFSSMYSPRKKKQKTKHILKLKCHGIERLPKPGSTWTQCNSSRLLKQAHGQSAGGKSAAGTVGKPERNKETKRGDHERAHFLPEIVDWHSIIFKGALLVQMCLLWCATLVPSGGRVVSRWTRTHNRTGRGGPPQFCGWWLLGNVGEKKKRVKMNALCSTYVRIY